MAQTTNQYKRTVSGSIGAGIGSVFGGSGKTYFILEHKSTSKYHRAGETQEIIVDQIELGREAKCQVRYDDSFGTVSRRHAAIYRDGDRWKLVTLSETNSTLLNGQRITSEAYLQNGDEIQLSSSGPRLGFILPTGKKSTVGSIGLTRRLSLFRQQALTPYKRAITALSVILVLVIAGGLYWGYGMQKNYEAQLAQLEQQKAQLLETVTTDNFNEVMKQVKDLDVKIDNVKPKVIYASGGVAQAPKSKDPIVENTSSNPVSDKVVSGMSDIAACNQHVYAVFLDELYYVIDGKRTYPEISSGFVGTGFMLNDGRFVTARHVVEPWYYYNFFTSERVQEFYKGCNWASFNMGKVTARYTIVSPKNKRYSFTNEQFICNRSNDVISKEDYSGQPAIFRTSVLDRYDWAYFQTSAAEGLKYDTGFSASLSQGTPLDILGYPKGMGAEDINNLRPIYSSCLTSGDGLNSDGLIISSNTDVAGGNSGGPVLAKKDGGYVVVGLLSGSMLIEGPKGIIVPIIEVRR